MQTPVSASCHGAELSPADARRTPNALVGDDMDAARREAVTMVLMASRCPMPAWKTRGPRGEVDPRVLASPPANASTRLAWVLTEAHNLVARQP
jgi:hypothetical protein